MKFNAPLFCKTTLDATFDIRLKHSNVFLAMVPEGITVNMKVSLRLIVPALVVVLCRKNYVRLRVDLIWGG